MGIRELNYMEISREALYRNAKTVCDNVGVPVIGVLKSDGYGVSVVEAALAWQRAGAKLFAVSMPEEALELRRAGFTEDVLLLSPMADPQMVRLMLEHRILLTVTGLEMARLYCACRGEEPVRAHLAVDTGMGRFGVRWTDLRQLQAIYDLPGLRLEGIYSHFAKSFEKTYRRTRVQLERFLQVTRALTQAGYCVGMRHMANSCAALRFPETRLDAVRVGSALVGALCAQVPVSLQPVGVFRARVLDRKTLQRGDTTGYASVCHIRKATCAVVVAIGTADGFGTACLPDKLRLRDLASWLWEVLRAWHHPPTVRVEGRELKVVGRIGREFTLFDATGVALEPGEWVSAQVPLLFPGRRRVFR